MDNYEDVLSNIKKIYKNKKSLIIIINPRKPMLICYIIYLKIIKKCSHDINNNKTQHLYIIYLYII